MLLLKFELAHVSLLDLLTELQVEIYVDVKLEPNSVVKTYQF
jgi:hypothetical protein